MKLFTFLVVAGSISASTLHAQGPDKCDRGVQLEAEDIQSYGQIFISEDFAEFRVRNGIRQLDTSAPMQALEHSRTCNRLMPHIRKAIRDMYGSGTAVRVNQYEFAFMQFGPYYGVSMDLDPAELPAGTAVGGLTGRFLIFDEASLQLLGILFM
jgi:hypothetical protein